MSAAPWGPRDADAVPPWRVMTGLQWTLVQRTLLPPGRNGWRWAGLVAGTTAAGGTVLLALIAPSTLPLALGLWALGCLVAPVLVGRPSALRPELFVSTGLARHRLVGALLMGSAVSVPTAVMAVAATGVLAASIALGGVVVLAVGAVGSITTFGLLVASARLAAEVAAVLLRSRVGAVVAGSATGLLMAVVAQGWALIPASTSVSVQTELARIANLLPTGWALQALDAAAADRDGAAAALLVAQAATTALALAVWAALASRPHHHAAPTRPVRLLRAKDRGSAARAAERRAWSRDLVVTQRWSFAIVYATAFCLLPLAVGWTVLVPWIPCAVLVMVTTLGSNGYGATGTSLWLVLAADAGRADVRARAAGVAIRGGAVAAAGLALTALWAGDQLPLVVATTIAAVGAAAGVSVLLAAWMPSRARRAHQRAGDPFDTGDGAESLGAAYVALVAMVVILGPVVVAGLLLGWWAVAVGIAVGLATVVASSDLATRRLEQDGDRVLRTLQGGSVGDNGTAELVAIAAPLATRYRSLPRWRRILVSCCFGLGAIPLIPQGILPLVFLSRGVEARAWFVAMYQSEPWSWMIAAAMTGLGVAMFVSGFVIVLRAQRNAVTTRPQPLGTTTGDDGVR